MFFLIVKPDSDMKPHTAKTRIVVLGDQENLYLDKQEKYAPVLSS